MYLKKYNSQTLFNKNAFNAYILKSIASFILLINHKSHDLLQARYLALNKEGETCYF